VADLSPNAQNSRTHTDEQVAQVASSLRGFGWMNLMLVDADGPVISDAVPFRVAAVEWLISRCQSSTIGEGHPVHAGDHGVTTRLDHLDKPL
jgi:hypothetical protein